MLSTGTIWRLHDTHGDPEFWTLLTPHLLKVSGTGETSPSYIGMFWMKHTSHSHWSQSGRQVSWSLTLLLIGRVFGSLWESWSTTNTLKFYTQHEYDSTWTQMFRALVYLMVRMVTSFVRKVLTHLTADKNSVATRCKPCCLGWLISFTDVTKLKLSTECFKV